jgi:hypothetical protein
MEAGTGAIATSAIHSKEVSVLPFPVVVDPADFSASPGYPFPIGGSSAQPMGESSCAATEPNHYAVVTVDAAGLALRGWDFRTLDQAKTFGDQLCRRGLRVQVWACDEYGRRLARIRAAPAPRRCAEEARQLVK